MAVGKQSTNIWHLNHLGNVDSVTTEQKITFEEIGCVVIWVFHVNDIGAIGFVAFNSGISCCLEPHKTKFTSENKDWSVDDGQDEGFFWSECCRIHSRVEASIRTCSDVSSVACLQCYLSCSISDFLNADQLLFFLPVIKRKKIQSLILHSNTHEDFISFHNLLRVLDSVILE